LTDRKDTIPYHTSSATVRQKQTENNSYLLTDRKDTIPYHTSSDNSQTEADGIQQLFIDRQKRYLPYHTSRDNSQTEADGIQQHDNSYLLTDRKDTKPYKQRNARHKYTVMTSTLIKKKIKYSS
jgi:hypothetical protein